MRTAIASLMLLGACAAREVPPTAPEAPEAVACRAEWPSSVERRRLMQQRADSNMFQIDQQIEEARLRAFRDCMRRRGLVEGDGVERRRR